MEKIVKALPKNTIVVSTTGKTSRELFEIRERNNESHSSDFLTVGSMGHCSSIALGIAISNPDKKVVCIDGDGSLIMHMGIISTIGNISPKNFYHILINNYVHESVGGQKTSASVINMKSLFLSNKYKTANSVSEAKLISKSLSDLFFNEGPNILEIIVKPGSRIDLGRPSIVPSENKKSLVEFIKN